MVYYNISGFQLWPCPVSLKELDLVIGGLSPAA